MLGGLSLLDVGCLMISNVLVGSPSWYWGIPNVDTDDLRQAFYQAIRFD